ncbi:type IIL restriction-modification enzyme MmeI [Lacticaseibacillus paracasei]
MHMVWMQTVDGRLKDNFRYSNILVYNTVPIPKLSSEQSKYLSGC